MTQHYTTATVFGGTGFIGRQVVRELAKRGIVVKIATRVPESAYFLKPCGTVGQIVPMACDVRSDESLRQVICGSDYVINCIGVLYERGKRQTFENLHARLPGRIAAICASEGVSRLVHISALGIEISGAAYARSKRAGEEAVIKACPAATILRPSVVFGEDDNFFNMFAKMASILPVLPLIGGGHTKFQPVYVGDVADAVMAVIDYTKDHSGKACAGLYELGGPEVVTLRDIYQRLIAFTGLNPALLPLPFFMAKIQAAFLSLLPKPLLTPDQVEMLKSNAVVSGDFPGLAELGIQPTAMDIILPQYLDRYRPGGRFAQVRQAP